MNMKNYNNSRLPLKGYMVIEDLDGNILVEKENMIVESGRSFIRDLVYNQVATTTIDDRKFSYIRLGSDGTASYSGMTDLNAHIADIANINITSSGTLVWSEVQTVYSYSTDSIKPASPIDGELFIYINETPDPDTYTLFEYTSGTPGSWDEGLEISYSSELPIIDLESHGDYYFNTRNNKLYYTSYILENLPASLPLGLKISIDLEGNGSTTDPARELAIFLEDASEPDPISTLFSRIVFDPLPITAEFRYRLTYYIYF